MRNNSDAAVSSSGVYTGEDSASLGLRRGTKPEKQGCICVPDCGRNVLGEGRVRIGGTPKTEEKPVNVAEVGGVGSCCDGDFEELGTGWRVDGDLDEVRALRVRSCDECGSQVEIDGKREDRSSLVMDPTSVLAPSSCSTSCFLRLDPLASEEDWRIHCLHPSSSRRFTFSVKS